MKTRRIVTFANHLGSIGGTEKAQLEIFRGLSERGWDVHLLYVSRGDYWPAWQEFVASATRIPASFPDRSHPVRTTVGATEALIRSARRHPSLTYVHNAGDVPVAFALGVVTRAPVVAHVHLPPPVRQPEWLNSLLRRTAAVLAPSRDTVERWVERARLVPRRVQVVPTGVDVERFRPLSASQRAAVRAGIGVAPDERMILYLGRIDPDKGIHLLIDAARLLNDRAALVVCGRSSDVLYLDQIEQDMARLSASTPASAYYLGHRSDVPALMGAADLVVVPSRWPDPQPLVISEAMASGTPVVGFDTGGIADCLAGFPDQVVPAIDVGALAKAIARCVSWRLSDPGLGDRTRAWAVAHMSITSSADAVHELLAAVLAHRERRCRQPF